MKGSSGTGVKPTESILPGQKIPYRVLIDDMRLFSTALLVKKDEWA